MRSPLRTLCWVAGSVVALAVLCGAPELLFLFGVGWLYFLRRAWDHVILDRVAVVSAVICLIAVTAGLHALCRWLYRSMGPEGGPRHWRLRWTGTMIAILVLMFATGISIVALAHQMLWVARSPRPLYDDAHVRVHCASNMRQIALAVFLYATDHAGHFPGELAELGGQSLSASVFVCPSSRGQQDEGATTRDWATQFSTPGHLSYVYLGQGLTLSVKDSAERPMLYELPSDHYGDGMNIAFADGHVEWFTPEKAEAILGPFIVREATTRP